MLLHDRRLATLVGAHRALVVTVERRRRQRAKATPGAHALTGELERLAALLECRIAAYFCAPAGAAPASPLDSLDDLAALKRALERANAAPSSDDDDADGEACFVSRKRARSADNDGKTTERASGRSEGCSARGGAQSRLLPGCAHGVLGDADESLVVVTRRGALPALPSDDERLDGRVGLLQRLCRARALPLDFFFDRQLARAVGADDSDAGDADSGAIEGRGDADSGAIERRDDATCPMCLESLMGVVERDGELVVVEPACTRCDGARARPHRPECALARTGACIECMAQLVGDAWRRRLESPSSAPGGGGGVPCPLCRGDVCENDLVRLVAPRRHCKLITT